MFQLHPQLVADCFVIGDLPLSRLLMLNDKQYPWFVLVPRRKDIQEIYQLTDVDQIQLNTESTTLARSMMTVFEGDKMNIAALGNVVPQLHIHHIVRYTSDPAWPTPVWGKVPSIPYDQPEERVETLLTELRKHLDIQQN